MFGPVAGRWISVGLAASCAAWVALLASAPAWRDPSEPVVLRGAAAAVYAAGGRVCHQDPGRSFHSGGEPWAVCARCTGLYGGAVAGSVAVLAWAVRRRSARGPRPGAERARWPLLAAGAPTALSWAVEFAGLAAVPNGVRCALALPLGAVAAWIVTAMLAGEME